MLIIFLISSAAGLFGSLLGLGGGIIVIPALTLLLRIDIHYAIGASIISVIATSSGAAVAYLRGRLTNLRLAMVLEIATTTGAITGALGAGHINPRWLYILFGIVMGYSALAMLRKRNEMANVLIPADPLADKLALHDTFYDDSVKRPTDYRVTRTPLGLLLMYVAGLASGLLGIGSGALKVPAMDLAMQLPIKVSTATSNFMIGVTAAASAGVYFSRGEIHPLIAGPVAAGVLLGAIVGSRYIGRISNKQLRTLFVAILLFISIMMFSKGI